MRHTLEAVRGLLKEKTADEYALKTGVICLDVFAALALLDLVEKELNGFTSQPWQSWTAPLKGSHDGGDLDGA